MERSKSMRGEKRKDGGVPEEEQEGLVEITSSSAYR